MGTRGMLGLNSSSKDIYKKFKVDIDKEIQDVIIEIEQMKEKAELEKRSNDQLLPFYRGKPVLYKQEICFMHYQSKCFLNGSKNVPVFEKSAYRCELSTKLNSGMIFQIYPKFKQEEGKAVRLDFPSFIFNVSK